jgi:hypothetical protein
VQSDGRHDTQHYDTQHNDIQHNDTQHKGLVCDTHHNSALHYAECRILFIVILGVIMLNATVLSVVAPLDGQ